MSKCHIPKCLHPVSSLAEDNKCIFHTETGKIKEYDKERKPIFIRPEERDEKAKKVVNEFISQFTKSLKELKKICEELRKGNENLSMEKLLAISKQRNSLDCSNFIFPYLNKDEWYRLWEPFLKHEGETKKVEIPLIIDFSDSKFGGEVHFENSEFIETVSFKDCKFYHLAFFKGCKFENNADFSNCVFFEGAYFEDSEFYSVANFTKARFHSELTFKDAEFKGNFNFKEAEFIKDSKNNKKIDFTGAEFFNYSIFENVNWGKNKIVFDEAEFKTYVNFYNSIFKNEVTFIDTKIDCKIEFVDVTIVKGIFKQAKFHKEADFINIKKSKKIDFKNAEIYSLVIINTIESKNVELDFSELRFRKGGTIILENISLDKASFINTPFYITYPRFHFFNIRLNENKIIYDETKTKNKKLRENELEEIERIYRGIRICYESQGEYADAGDFYLHEMRVRGKRLKGFLKILHYLYGLISKYGESVGRAFGWLLGTISLFSFLLPFAGFCKANKIFKLFPGFNLSHIKETFEIFGTSIILILNYTLLGRIDPYQPLNAWGLGVLISARIIGLSILTLLLLAIRRRFKR